MNKDLYQNFETLPLHMDVLYIHGLNVVIGGSVVIEISMLKKNIGQKMHFYIPFF